MMDKLRTSINFVGQPFVDDPVFAQPKQESSISRGVRAAFGDGSNLQPLLVGHERVRLRWMKPDGKGGLTPRGKR